MKQFLKYFFTSIISIIATLAIVYGIYLWARQSGTIIVDTSDYYTSADVEDMVEEAKASSKQDLLSSIKASLEEGTSVITMLKSFYPDYLVIASGNRYNWVEIDESIGLNNYDINNLLVDETTGLYSYVEDGNVTSKKGIDVSSHQGDIDWQAVASDGVEFAFIRAVYRGYGSGKIMIDEKCLENIQEAQAAGIQVGVYVFSQAISQAEALEEAATLLTLLDGYSLDLPVVFDVEFIKGDNARTDSVTTEERTDIAISFLDAVSTAGYDTMIYHNTEMGGLGIDLTRLTDYKKWFAGYNKEFYWPYEFDFWQYSETGSVAGINGNVDLDIWFTK